MSIVAGGAGSKGSSTNTIAAVKGAVMSKFVVQETWQDPSGKKHYGSFHDGSRRITDIDKEALFSSLEEAKQFLESLSGELGEMMDSPEIVNVTTRIDR